jgi:hypothetical protein
LGKSFFAISGLGDDVNIFLGVDQHHYSGSCQRVVINYHDSDHKNTFPDPQGLT